MSSKKLTELTPFVDNVGRIVIGRTIGTISKTAKTIQVKNPAIVNIQMQEDGQVSVQLIPYMFKEFLLEDSQSETVWEFGLNNITYSYNVKLDERVTQQYEQVFEISDEEREELIQKMKDTDTGTEEGEVVKIFDDPGKATWLLLAEMIVKALFRNVEGFFITRPCYM